MELPEYKPSQDTPLINVDKGYSIMNFQGDFDDSFLLTALYYRKSKQKCFVYILLLVLTLGILYLFQRWFVHFRLLLMYEQCKLNEMTHLLIIKSKNKIKVADDTLVRVQQEYAELPNSSKAVIFIYELSRFYIDVQSYEMFYLRNNFQHLTCEQLCQSTGIANPSKNIYGPNVIDIPVKSIPHLLLDEILTPFNIFQFAALALWGFDDYLAYSLLILFITLIQIGYALKDLQDSLYKLRNMIYFKAKVFAFRNGSLVLLDTTDLIPGDVIQIENQQRISCDCILIEGRCTVNEAVLSGESIPINKVALQKTKIQFNAKGNESCFLYSGTFCLRSTNENEGRAFAVVYQIGFQTLKGSLVRSMLFSVTQTFSFQRDSIRYLFVLSGLAFFFAIFTLITGFKNQLTFGRSFLNALEIVTMIIPPTLPTALGAGITLAISRLEKQDIQCIKPDKVNVAAKVNVVAFDKTGTLTELGLEVLGCRPAKGAGFERQAAPSEVSKYFNRCMATCHSLNFIDGVLQGDPLDLNLFNSTGWRFEDGFVEREAIQLRILRRFEFVPELQRQSVIVDDYQIYCKGSPEQIKLICSRIPDNYSAILKAYTSQGFRVLACAYKDIKNFDVEAGMREEIETDLEFLGFVIFENRLKHETAQTLSELRMAQLKTIMVTGDNPLTAVHVAQQCGILDQKTRTFLSSFEEGKLYWSEITAIELNLDTQCSVYSLEHLNEEKILFEEILNLNCKIQLTIIGDVFLELQNMFTNGNKELVLQILSLTYVYARMKPVHKGDLMILLKQDPLNFLAFCGDGTNDTYALKMADIGLSLSNGDAALAAPFTSTMFELSSIVTLIREGRASLVTSVECFKFMTLYSCIQSAAILQCYYLQTDFSTQQYLFQDLWLIIPLAFSMDLTKAYPKLASYRPLSDLISAPVIISVVVSVCICASTQIMGLQILFSQSFYQQDSKILSEDSANQINSLLVIFSNTQILATAIAFTQGPPFRQQVYENIYYMFAITVGILGHILIILFPLFSPLNIEVSFPEYFRWELLFSNVMIAVFIIGFEKLVVTNLVKRYSLQEVNKDLKL